MYIVVRSGLGDAPSSEPWRSRLGLRPQPQALRFMNLDQFRWNEASLTARLRLMVRQLAKHVRLSWQSMQPIGVIRLVGHTDNTGPEKYNINLGDRRAQAVKDELENILKEDMLKGRIRIVIFVDPSPGVSAPTADNRTREGRARNRSVEVFIGGPPPKTLFDPRPVPPPPTVKQPPIDLWTLPEKIKRRIEERDEEQRYNKPVPPPPPGKSLQDWLDERLDRLPQHRRLRDAILKGSCRLLEELFGREGGTLSDKQKEDFRTQCREEAKKPI